MTPWSVIVPPNSQHDNNLLATARDQMAVNHYYTSPNLPRLTTDIPVCRRVESTLYYTRQLKLTTCSLKLQNKSIMKKTVTIKYKIFKIQAFIDVNVLFLKTLFCFLPMRFRQMFFQLCLDEESLFTEITFIRLSIEIHVMF